MAVKDASGDKAMVDLEERMMALIKRDTYMNEQSEQWTECPLCFARVRALREKTELLGSVEQVEDRFQKAANAMTVLIEIAGAATMAVKQWKVAAVALKKARKQEDEMKERESKRLEKEAEKLRKKQDRLDKLKGDERGEDPKKRRAPAHFVPSETDPMVLQQTSWEAAVVEEDMVPGQYVV